MPITLAGNRGNPMFIPLACFVQKVGGKEESGLLVAERKLEPFHIPAFGCSGNGTARQVQR